jgi:hypothetical protein
MLRRILLALAVTASGVLGAATPARAHTDTCAWTALLITWDTLPMVTVAPGPSMTFTLLPTHGKCVLTESAPLAGGWITGSWAGTTTGTGTTSGGHDFSFTGVGGTLDVAGEAIGVIRMTPDLLNPTGYYYLAQLELTLVH